MRGNRLIVNSIPKRNKWCEKDALMVHACFQILVDCIEKEKLMQDRQYYFTAADESEEARKVLTDLNKLIMLYKWWINIGSKLSHLEVTSEEVTKKLHELIDLKGNLWT